MARIDETPTLNRNLKRIFAVLAGLLPTNACGDATFREVVIQPGELHLMIPVSWERTDPDPGQEPAADATFADPQAPQWRLWISSSEQVLLPDMPPEPLESLIPPGIVGEERWRQLTGDRGVIETFFQLAGAAPSVNWWFFERRPEFVRWSLLTLSIHETHIDRAETRTLLGQLRTQVAAASYGDREGNRDLRRDTLLKRATWQSIVALGTAMTPSVPSADQIVALSLEIVSAADRLDDAVRSALQASGTGPEISSSLAYMATLYSGWIAGGKIGATNPSSIEQELVAATFAEAEKRHPQLSAAELVGPASQQELQPVVLNVCIACPMDHRPRQRTCVGADVVREEGCGLAQHRSVVCSIMGSAT